MKKKYEFLPHTADVRVRAYGGSLEEAFTNSAYAVTDVVTDHTKIEKKVEKEFVVESESQESLLYDFLEQFLVLIDSDGFLLREILELQIQELSIESVGTSDSVAGSGGYKLSAKFVGDKYSDKYETKTHVKAITYEEMSIVENDGEWVIGFIVDI